MNLNRRELLLATLGVAATSRTALGETANSERPTVVLIYLDGGYHALFSAADAYVPRNLFSCTASNVRDLGNGLVVDAQTLGTLPDSVLQQMCTVGIRHGASGHDYALRNAWFDGKESFPLKLADALGGTSPFRCVHFGQGPARGAPHPSRPGVSMIAVPDLSVPVTLLTPPTDPTAPRRDLIARALRSSLRYATPRFERSPWALHATWEGSHALIGALEQPPPAGIDWAEISAAYGLRETDKSATSLTSQLAGAELMIRAGSDVVCVSSHGVGGENWDTHSDGSGDQSRAMMNAGVLPSLRVFLERTLAMHDRNVVTVLWGDFARLGGVAGRESGHANGTSATVFGKYVQPGTTGRPNINQDGIYALPSGTPSHRGFWSFLTALARAPNPLWGDNKHPTLLRAT